MSRGRKRAEGRAGPANAHEHAVAVDDERIRKGVAWLKANQRASGRWWTRSLNTEFWQFSTYHGTAHALLALGMCGEIPRREP